MFSKHTTNNKELDSFNDDLEKLFTDSIKTVVKGLSDEDKKKLQKEMENKGLQDMVNLFVTTTSDAFVTQIIKRQNTSRFKERLYAIGFRKRLRRRWSSYVNVYETLTLVCMESVIRLRNNLGTLRKNEPLLSTLVRLHTRCLRINNEILNLSLNGYGEAALSRWRSLHETAVVIAALSKLGNEGAKAFMAYNAVESYKAMGIFNTYAQALGEKKFTKSQIASAEKAKNQAGKKYGKQIESEYGWSNVASGPRIRSFKDLEKNFGPEHLRPYYKLASYSIHTNIKSLLTGEQSQAWKDSKILLVGPSDRGFEDALQLSALTVAYATVTFLTTYPNLENLSTAKAIMKYERLTSESFRLHFEKNNPPPHPNSQGTIKGHQGIRT